MSSADPYRAAPPPRAPRVIDTRRVAPRTLLAGHAVLTLVVALFSQRVEIDCVRVPDGGSCVFRAQRILGSSAPRAVPIADLVSARVERGDDTSRVSLDTREGDLPLTSFLDSSNGAEKAAMAAAINRFLARPDEPRLSAAYGSRWAGHLDAWLCFTALALALAYFTRTLRVTIDYAGRALHLQRPAFPWGRRTESFDLASIARADLEQCLDGDEPTYRIVLVRTAGEDVPLTRTFDSGHLAKQQAVAQINEALADRD